MTNRLLLPILLTVLPLASGWAQDGTIDLHLSPDIYSTKVASIGPGDSRLGDPAPVLDEAKAALGWQFADFSGDVDGYVPDVKIGKDLLPVENTLIRANPAEDAEVLGVYSFGDPIEVIDTGAWWKVRVQTTFPVYFVADEPAPLPPVTGTALLLAAEPLADAPATLVEQAPLTDGAIAPAAATALSAYPQPKQVERPDITGQSYAGIFRKAKRRFGLFKPHGTYFLEDAEGKRIAWVNVSRTVIPGTMATYIDQSVIIHGERTLLPKSRDWIIHARNIRVN
ncbi:MAG: SH3 domain-containing protein [Opitutales bacterium]